MKSLLPWAIGICLGTLVSGQTPPYAAPNYFAQDTRGFVWAATNIGIDRYDAHGFTRFGAAQGLPPSVAGAIAATPDGAVWAASIDGLYRYEKGRFDRVLRKRFGFVASDSLGHLFSTGEYLTIGSAVGGKDWRFQSFLSVIADYPL